MGQEIHTTRFTEQDLRRFSQRLADETRLAQDTYAQGGFAAEGRVAGFELEAWLLDRHFYPVPCNQAFLARMADPQVVAELSRGRMRHGRPEAKAEDD